MKVNNPFNITLPIDAIKLGARMSTVRAYIAKTKNSCKLRLRIILRSKPRSETKY